MKQSGTKTQAAILFPMNYGYTTLVSCIRSSPYYFEAFRADWKRVFYSILSGAKAAVGTLYPANYEYTTLVSCIRSSSYYSEAFHQDRKTVFFLERSGTKAQVSTLFPTNYGYTTLAPAVRRGLGAPPRNGWWRPRRCPPRSGSTGIALLVWRWSGVCSSSPLLLQRRRVAGGSRQHRPIYGTGSPLVGRHQ